MIRVPTIFSSSHHREIFVHPQRCDVARHAAAFVLGGPYESFKVYYNKFCNNDFDSGW